MLPLRGCWFWGSSQRPPLPLLTGGWGEQGSWCRSQALRPKWPWGATQAPGVLSPRSLGWGRLPGVGCAGRSTGLHRWELGTGCVLCVQTQLRSCKVCRAMVVAACSPNPQPGDPQKSPSRAGAAAEFPERPSPVLSWVLMQKSLGGGWATWSPTLGWGDPGPAHRHPGGCALLGGWPCTWLPGPCKRSRPIDGRDVSAPSRSSEAHAVSLGHGQLWEGQDRAETRSDHGSWPSQPPWVPPGQPLAQPRPWSLWNARPLSPHPRGRVAACHTRRGHTPWGRGGEAREPRLLSAEGLRLPAQVWLQNFSPFLERTVLQENTVLSC